MEEYLNILPGAVSIMGLMNDRENRVQLLIDRQVMRRRRISGLPPLCEYLQPESFDERYTGEISAGGTSRIYSCGAAAGVSGGRESEGK